MRKPETISPPTTFRVQVEKSPNWKSPSSTRSCKVEVNWFLCLCWSVSQLCCRLIAAPPSSSGFQPLPFPFRSEFFSTLTLSGGLFFPCRRPAGPRAVYNLWSAVSRVVISPTTSHLYPVLAPVAGFYPLCSDASVSCLYFTALLITVAMVTGSRHKRQSAIRFRAGRAAAKCFHYQFIWFDLIHLFVIEFLLMNIVHFLSTD